MKIRPHKCVRKFLRKLRVGVDVDRFTMKMPVGPDGASFRDPVTGGMIRDRVVELLVSRLFEARTALIQGGIYPAPTTQSNCDL